MSHPMETYYGTVKSPADAIKLFEACRLGLLPRVQRRLSEKERQQIRSGSVFVWDEREAGMRRWTDGKSWSASRVSGSFLTYREMEGKRASGFGGPGGRRTAGKTPDSGRGSDEDQDDGEPDGYRYKIDGLIKQSFSITTSQGQHLHLISYFSRGGPELMLPTQDIKLRGVHPAKGLYPESNLNEPSGPATMRGPMQHQPVYTGPPPPQGPPHPAHSPYHPAPYSQPPPSYCQPSSAWPPSPVATPPYSSAHYHQPPQPYPPHTLPPPQQHHPHGPPPAMAYSHGSAHQYDRLPPPQPALPAHHRPGMILPQPYPIQNQPHSPHQQYQHPLPHPSPQPHSYHSQQQPPQPPPPPPQQQEQQQQQQQQQQQHITSPHSPHAIPQRSSRLDSLQAAAAQAAVMIDPALAAQLGRSPQGPQQSQNGALTLSPPYRNRSPSPPGNRAPDGKDPNGQAAGNKASLSAILHPVSVGSESNGADSGLNGGHSPPRAPSSVSTNGPTTRNGRETMEARAIGALDKTFCMT